MAIDERHGHPPNAFHGANAMAAIFDNPTTINFVHRTLGILVFLAVGIFWLQNRRFSAPSMRRLEHALLLMVFLHSCLGSPPCCWHPPIFRYSGVWYISWVRSSWQGSPRPFFTMPDQENLLSVKPPAAFRIFAANTCCERESYWPVDPAPVST